MGFTPIRLARQLALRPSRIAVLVNGQYRRSSRASPLQSIPLASARVAQHPELHAMNRLSLLGSLRCVRLVLWDETRRCLVPSRHRPLSRVARNFAGAHNRSRNLCSDQ